MVFFHNLRKRRKQTILSSFDLSDNYRSKIAARYCLSYYMQHSDFTVIISYIQVILYFLLTINVYNISFLIYKSRICLVDSNPWWNTATQGKETLFLISTFHKYKNILYSDAIGFITYCFLSKFQSDIFKNAEYDIEFVKGILYAYTYIYVCLRWK